jgi:hypothetical protein
MLWRRKKRDANKRHDDPAEKRQYWDRNPQPLDAMTNSGGVPDIGSGPGEVYPDEIDPEWRGPQSAED